MHNVASFNKFTWITELPSFASYTKAARRPYSSEPIGMLVMRMLWFTPALFGPKSSDVTDTAAENTKPELIPIKPVPARNIASLPDRVSRRKPIGVGTSATASHPVLAKYILLHYQDSRLAFMAYCVSASTIIVCGSIVVFLMVEDTYSRRKSGAAASNRPKKEHEEYSVTRELVMLLYPSDSEICPRLLL